MIGRKLTLIVPLALALLATPLAAEAQQSKKVWKIAVLIGTSHGPQFEGFWQRLRELGYVPGRTILIETRSTEGEHIRARDLAAELVNLNPDILVTNTTPAAIAAKQATSSIPIVAIGLGDPVRAGVVPSLARPGGNLTGLALLSPELSVKRLELLRLAYPRVSRVAVLWNPINPNHPYQVTDTKAAGKALGINIEPFEARSISDLNGALVAAKRHADALLVLPDGVTTTNRKAIIDFAVVNRFPVTYPFPFMVNEGGLMSYGVNLHDLYRRAAWYVDKILKGARPADLPIQQPTKFEFVINLKTAKALGLTIPQSLLFRADEVIQ